MNEPDLAAFLRARLDELETAARAAAEYVGGASWGVEVGGDVVLEPLPPPVAVSPDEMIVAAPVVAELEGAGWHVAMHSPARVLSDIAAKRTLVDQCEVWQDTDGPAPRYLAGAAAMIMCILATVWDDHEDYDPNWAPL
ncbi:DUF6221 family protein [Phytoactinopolyspora limicola]|uniref:DUF6221 family protein n=1 Tax=Phytoactinopolyspora limicola TaxID=2715536 RepID=UPI00140A0ABD|nr:DUF6221 family protein [Phytoactinopolyspora limicola]